MKKNNTSNIKKNNIIWFISGVIITLFIVALFKNTDIYNYEKSLTKQIKRVNNTVVVIQTDSESTGTGFIYKVDSKYGYVLTNEHILDGEDISVTLSNDIKLKGELLGKDKYIDLAVVRIDKKYVKNKAKLGNSNNITAGERVFTIGTPINYEFRQSVSSGIVSGKNRVVETEVDSDKWLMELIQFNAPINSGNSGGPLFNNKGEVIGICVLKMVDYNIEGMSFAIPINYAKKYIAKLERKEKIKWPELGADIENNDIYDNSIIGTRIINVYKNTTAYDAGLKENDIIIKINNYEIKNNKYLYYVLYKYKINDKITITYLRNGKEEKTKVRIK